MGKKSKVSSLPPKISSRIKFRRVLAIESSCDDTSVAIVDHHGFVLSMESENQDNVHAPFGGIIPELACRNHTLRLLPLIEKVVKKAGLNIEEMDGLAVTSRPGLLGSLLVGVTVAKTLSMIYKLPLLGVNHIEGHIYAPFLKDPKFNLHVTDDKPFIALCVSGGHTSLIKVKSFGEYTVLGRTVDDAAGEAFDKFGKVLGLGYPAGRRVDELAGNGKRQAFQFPRPLLHKPGLDFSFSGLKTSGHLEVKKILNQEGSLQPYISDLCASYQEAVVDVLIEKTKRALKKTSFKRVAITGGVSCNSRLREQAFKMGEEMGVEVLIPAPQYCTDNGAMIGYVGLRRLEMGNKDDLTLTAQGSSRSRELW